MPQMKEKDLRDRYNKFRAQLEREQGRSLQPDEILEFMRGRLDRAEEKSDENAQEDDENEKKKQDLEKKEFRRVFPDSSAGHNPNVPIRVYDTHPNQYFLIGEKVIPSDDKEAQVVGTVVARIAEDRLLVDWGRIVDQVDVDEVYKLWESASQAGIRQIGDLQRPLLPSKTSSKRRSNSRQADFNDVWRARPSWMGGEGFQNRPTSLGGRGTYQQQWQNAVKQGKLVNYLLLPEVKAVLNKVGMPVRTQSILQNFLQQMNTAAASRGQYGTHGAQGNSPFQTWKMKYNLPKPRSSQSAPNQNWGFMTPEEVQEANSDPLFSPPNTSGTPVSAPGTPAPIQYPPGFPGVQQPAGTPVPSSPRASKMASLRLPPHILAARTRRRGLEEILYYADIMQGSGYPRIASSLRMVADVAAAVDKLYKNPHTRFASCDDPARKAIKVACRCTLQITKALDNLGLDETARMIESSVAKSLSYERV